MDLNYYSDYGSNTSVNTGSSPWDSGDVGGVDPRLGAGSLYQRSREAGDVGRLANRSSVIDIILEGRTSREDAMREFRMNGLDSPLEPQEEKAWVHMRGDGGGGYRRQWSWPATRTAADHAPPDRRSWPDSMPDLNKFGTPRAEERAEPARAGAELGRRLAALLALPPELLEALLRAGPAPPAQECRFCKNNGERAAYYSSHRVKDAGGRVTCPVLRAFVCARCGATADRAHTLKYCPLTTQRERVQATAMMQSVRMSSGRRRAPAPAPAAPAPSSAAPAPLGPQWAALERKLLLQSPL